MGSHFIQNSCFTEAYQENNDMKLIPDLILEIDDHGTIVKKIAPLGNIFVLSTDAVPGVNFCRVIPAGADLFNYYLQKAVQTQTIQRFTIPLISRFFEIRLNPGSEGKIILIFSELSQRVPPTAKLEKHIFNDKENLEVALHSITDGIIATDINGRIIFMNNAAEKITGWLLKEAIGEKLSTVYRTSNQEENNNSKCFDFWEHTFLFTKDGRQRVITDNGASIHDQNGEITGVVIVFRDITEKWRMEEEIERTQRLEFIGNLAGGIAHDFNNILAVVLANIQLVKIIQKKGGDTEKYLNGMEDAVKRASSLTKQLLTFAKGGAPIKKPTFLAELLMETVEIGIKGTNLNCIFSIQDQLWAVEIDSGQISQVFNNLTNNAVQTIPNNGMIEVSAQNISITNQDILPLPLGDYIQITFKDNGPGISNEKLMKIFDPYYLLGQKENGLGLAVAYSIIKRHNGLINVQSKIGSGTCFTIYLPAVRNNNRVQEVIQTSEQKGKKLLLMDDEAHIIELVGEMLIHMDYRVETAQNGVEALELFKQAKQANDPFDVIIMDLTIPGGMGGREAISFIREFDPAVKAIVSSGYSNDPVMSDCKRYGFNGMVTKPYKIEELCQEINRVLFQEATVM
ncbi:MAG: response regulator [Bacteroidota bacterium]